MGVVRPYKGLAGGERHGRSRTVNTTRFLLRLELIFSRLHDDLSLTYYGKCFGLLKIIKII